MSTNTGLNMLLGAVLITVIFTNGLVGGSSVAGSGYGAVIDAGSSGSRVYIYRWNPDDWTRRSLPDITLHYTHKVRPGLSSYAENINDIRNHVIQLVAKVKQNVPEEVQEETPLLFMATAGLRLLRESNALQIIQEVERILDDATVNPFWHDASTIRILSGEGEGSFSWLAVNYLNGLFQDLDSSDSVAVLEMGGASSQITFIPEVDPLADKFPIQILGGDYSVYTHSYLGYGQEAIQTWIEETLAERNAGKEFVDSPCMLDDDLKEVVMNDGRKIIYFGTGKPKLCEQLVEEYFTMEPTGSCNPKPCGLGSVYQPSIPDNMQLYAMASYFFVARDIGLITEGVQKAQLCPIKYKEKAYEFCARNYEDVAAEVGESPFISMSCSSALAIYKQLTIGFGLNDRTTNLHVVNKVNRTEISWTLGALIYEVEKTKCGSGLEKSRVLRILEEVVATLNRE